MNHQSAGPGGNTSGASTLRFDVIDGFTAAAVVLPKAMAYATVAGLPVAVGRAKHATRNAGPRCGWWS